MFHLRGAHGLRRAGLRAGDGGNVHDSVTFDEVCDKVTEAFPERETIAADSAYRVPHICKKVFEDGRVLSTAYKRPQTKKRGHEWWKKVHQF